MEKIECKAMALSRRFYILPTIVRTEIPQLGILLYSLCWLNLSLEFKKAE